MSHRLAIADEAIDKGFQVVIGYGELGEANPELLTQKGLKMHLIPMYRGSINPLKDLKTLYHIWQFFTKESPDIVHLVTIKPYLYGGIIARLTKIPNLVSAVTGLGSLFVHKNLKSYLLRWLLNPIYRLAFNHPNQIVIVQNKDDAKFLVQMGFVDLKKIRLLRGSGINLEKFKNLCENDEIPKVCFAARLLRDKGVYDFVSAARLLRQRGVKADFLLAGDIDTKSPSGLSVYDINKLKTDGSVEVLGYQKNIAQLFEKSHIVCLPSYYREGLPKILIEAAAACRPVVTTDVPGCRDAIIPNKTGILVPAKKPEKLADALEWLINRPQERVKMGKAGRKLAEKEFQINKIVKEHIDIYQELIHSNN